MTLRPFSTLAIDPVPGSTVSRTVTPGSHVAVVRGARPGLYLGFEDPRERSDLEVEFPVEAFDVLSVPTDRIWIRADPELDDQGTLVLAFFHPGTGPPDLSAAFRIIAFSHEVLVAPSSTSVLVGPVDPTREAGHSGRTSSRRMLAAFACDLVTTTGGGTTSALRLVAEHPSGDVLLWTRQIARLQLDDGSSSLRVAGIDDLDLPSPATRWRWEFRNTNTANTAKISYLVQTYY